MPEYLEHLSKSMSFCSKNLREAVDKKDKQQEKYWRAIHQVLVYACRDIQEINYKEIK